MPSLAIVYSPFQSFDGLFEPDVALCKGTLFSGLDKPFFGTCDGRSIARG
ncbi:MAG: spore coat associated protein CotJA [Clostridia bacterium]|nr:spore coat associated protein CotJA [Clostridia bacterium]